MARPAQSTTAVPGTAPVKVFRLGNVSASIFARHLPAQADKPARTYHSVVLQKSYLDDQGIRQYSNSFDSYELPVVERVLKMATDLVIQVEGEMNQ